MTIPREIKRQNHRLGQSLGFNPHGEPEYKWIWVNDWMHWMQDITGYQPTASESGLIVMTPILKSRRMIPDLDGVNKDLRNRWHVGHWHDCGDERLWREAYGTASTWSRFGFYSMTDCWSQQGQVPTEQTTDDLIARVKKFRATTLADARAIFKAQEEKLERDEDSTRLDVIGDAMTAFWNVPGTRSGSVSFPSTSKQLNPPAAAGA